MTPAIIEKKIQRLRERIVDIEKRIIDLQATKNEFEKEITDLQTEEIMYLVRSSKLTIEELADAMEFGKRMKVTGTSADDVAELLGIPIRKKEVKKESCDKTALETETPDGGLKDEA